MVLTVLSLSDIITILILAILIKTKMLGSKPVIMVYVQTGINWYNLA
jgi:hypothetical protein